MAAAIATSDMPSELSTIHTITTENKQVLINRIVRQTVKEFNWAKQNANSTAFLTLLTKNSIEIANLTLDNLDTLTQEITMETVSYITALETYRPPEYRFLKPANKVHYNDMPYIIHMPQLNECGGFPLFAKFPWIIFRTSASKFSEIIPREYFDVIKYLGVVIVIITKKFRKLIPYLPDNVIHIELENYTSPFSLPEFRFPRFLQSYFDCEEKGFINFLPPTVRNIRTSSIDIDNMPSGLKDLTLLYNSDKTQISEFEILPLDMNSIIFHDIGSEYNYFNKTTINCPRGTKYFSISIGCIRGSSLTVSNTRTLVIEKWKFQKFRCPVYENVYPEMEFLEAYTKKPCILGEHLDMVYRQNIEFIMDDFLEHLILADTSSLDILRCISSISPNFKQITIYTNFTKEIQSTIKQIIVKRHDLIDQKTLLELQYSYEPNNIQLMHSIADIDYIIYRIESIINFHQRFPHITITILTAYYYYNLPQPLP